jgi:hypothetical protein
MIRRLLCRINLATAWAAAVAVIISVSTISARAEDDEASRRRITVSVLRIFLDREPTEAEIGADMGWHSCIEHAADLFAPQPEPATTVADAAIASCSSEAMRYMTTFKLAYHKDFGETDKPALIARVMAFRAAKQGARK